MAADLAGLCRPRQYRTDRRDRPHLRPASAGAGGHVNTGQRPKVDLFEDHAFVVLQMIDDGALNRYEQIAVFFGENFVVTFQERPGDPFNPVRKRIEASNPNRLRARKADYLAYALIDAIVDSYFPPVEAIGDRIDAIEDEMIGQAAEASGAAAASVAARASSCSRARCFRCAMPLPA